MFYNSTAFLSRYLLSLSATPVLGAILAFCSATSKFTPPTSFAAIAINMAKGLAVGVEVCASSKAVIGSVAAVDRLEEVTDGQLTGIDLWRSRSRLEIAVTSPYGHDHGQAV